MSRPSNALPLILVTCLGVATSVLPTSSAVSDSSETFVLNDSLGFYTLNDYLKEDAQSRQRGEEVQEGNEIEAADRQTPASEPKQAHSGAEG